jgi:hypothetical protein
MKEIARVETDARLLADFLFSSAEGTRKSTISADITFSVGRAGWNSSWRSLGALPGPPRLDIAPPMTVVSPHCDSLA